MPAPVALFAFNRPVHLQQTLTALAANDLAEQTVLHIFCDGPRNKEEEPLTAHVKEIATGAQGFAAVHIHSSPINKGLANSIIHGVTEIISEYGEAIVLEDDLRTSPYFLRYMNDGLRIYKDCPNVASIHGYLFPHQDTAPETFFLRGADWWGWGTWARAWQYFEPNGEALLEELTARGLLQHFDAENNYDFSGLLRDVISQKANSWAIRWHASTFLRNMLTLYPGRSLVQNIGADGSGTHMTSKTTIFDTKLSMTPIHVEKIEIAQHENMYIQKKKFLLVQSGGKVGMLKTRIRRKFPFLEKVWRYCQRSYHAMKGAK